MLSLLFAFLIQVNEIFDAISYCKGASVIRMVANYLGEAAFRQGLNIYLKKHIYANATTEVFFVKWFAFLTQSLKDLWDALSESSRKDVKDFMDNWIKKTGYPVLSLEQKDGNLHARQQRFLASTPEEQVVWWLSVGFVRYVLLLLPLVLPSLLLSQFRLCSSAIRRHEGQRSCA